MPLTEDQQQHVIDALNEHIKRAFVCPASGDSNWTVEASFTQLNAADNLNVTSIGLGNYPCVVVICDTCGYTALFNVYRLGLNEYFGLPARSK